MTATLSLTQLLEIWRDVAMGRLGDDRGAVHLKAGEWDALHAAFEEHGADPSPQAIFDYGKDDGELAGVPSLATDWPAHNNYKVELDATSQMYDSLVTLLRTSWRNAVQRRPPELGLLATAAGLAKLWRQEKEGHGALAFERCRSRLNKTVQDWQEKLVRRQAKPRRARTPKCVPVSYDYEVVDDQWESRVTAYFERLGVSSGDVAYDGNDRTLHDLMVQTRRNEEETLTYDKAARAFGLDDVPSRMPPDHRRAACATIRKAIWRFCEKWKKALAELFERLQKEGAPPAHQELLKQQGPPLKSLGKGVWRITVDIETRRPGRRRD